LGGFTVMGLPLDDAPDRIAVQAWRWTEGWVLVYTHQFDEAGQLGGYGSFGHALTRSVDLGEVAASRLPS
jgi:hypothetical protein